MKQNEVEVYKAESLSTSVERYERNMKFLEDNTELIFSTSQNALQTISNTVVGLGGIYRDLKQLEYSFKMYLIDADKSKTKIAFAQKQLEIMEKGMDKITDKILSFDINVIHPEQIKFRSELLLSLNKQLDIIAGLNIDVFNC